MKRNRLFRLVAAVLCAVMMLGIFSQVSTVSCMAADKKKDEEKKDPYELNKEVKEWLDSGHGIPGDAKYATLAGTSHLWEIDSTDISDGKVELKGVNEKRLVYGLELKNWVKTQFFYGDDFNSDNNRKKFVRPGGEEEF